MSKLCRLRRSEGYEACDDATAYFSYGQYNLGIVHAESDFTGSNFDAAGVWIK